MNYKKKKIVLALFLVLLITSYEKIMALTATPGTSFVGGGGGSYSVSSDGNGQLPEYKTRTFLVTLVDENGKKVDGTNSVYYRDSTNKDFRLISSGMPCSYKYSTASFKCKEYETDLTGDGKTYINSMDIIGQKFQDVVSQRKKIYKLSGGTNYDFVTSFLYHSDFLDSKEGYYDIDDSHWSQKRQEIAGKNYFILIEPVYEYYLKGSTYFGTSTELARELLKLGYEPWNLTAEFTYNIGINLYVTQEKAKTLGYKRITKGYMRMINGGANAGVPAKEWQAIASPEYGNGMGIIKLSDRIKKTTDIDIHIRQENCASEGETRSNGIIDFNLEIPTSTSITYEQLNNAGVELEKYETTDGKIICYDNIKYDFSNTINSLNDVEAKIHSYMDIKNGTVTITRYCYVSTKTQGYDSMIEFANNFDDYNNLKIPINIFGTTVDLEKKENDIEEDTSEGKNLVNRFGRYEGVYIVRNTITFGYKNNNSKIYIKSDPTKKDSEYIDSYIDFSNVSYGYSTKLLENAKDGKTYNLNSMNTILHMNVNSSSGGKKCEFKTKIAGDAQEKIKFRTISLNNPFPSRDASSRLPGSNWLGADNYVRTYINHNRGVNGSEVYNKEPIYTITLTPSQMIKIREYNKKHNYSDIDLNCVGENNTSCLSTFLRTTIDKKNITGSCMINSDNIISDPNGIAKYDRNSLVNLLINVNENNILKYNYTSEDLNMDFNKDGLLTLRDEYIYDNASKTTNYYTCADKTYENSGYIKEVSNNE